MRRPNSPSPIFSRETTSFSGMMIPDFMKVLPVRRKHAVMPCFGKQFHPTLSNMYIKAAACLKPEFKVLLEATTGFTPTVVVTQHPKKGSQINKGALFMSFLTRTSSMRDHGGQVATQSRGVNWRSLLEICY